jgi:hypothetical protein
MNYTAFSTRFPEGTEIGHDLTDTESVTYFDNGREVGAWRVDRGSTVGQGEVLSHENSWIARAYYRTKQKEIQR